MGKIKSLAQENILAIKPVARFQSLKVYRNINFCQQKLINRFVLQECGNGAEMLISAFKSRRSISGPELAALHSP